MTNEYEIRRQQEKAREQEVETKLRAVFKILKQKVQDRPDSERWDCRVDSDILYAHFSAGYGDKRIHVSGVYPRHADNSYVGDIWFTPEEREARKAKGLDTDYGKVPQPSITISADKTAEQIAKDIQRRLLPDVLDYRRRVQERIDSHNDYESVTQTALATLKKGKLTESEQKSHTFSGYIGKNYTDGRYEVKTSREEVSLELNNITVEQAEKILTIVLGNKKRG